MVNEKCNLANPPACLSDIPAFSTRDWYLLCERLGSEQIGFILRRRNCDGADVGGQPVRNHRGGRMKSWGLNKQADWNQGKHLSPAASFDLVFSQRSFFPVARTCNPALSNSWFDELFRTNKGRSRKIERAREEQSVNHSRLPRRDPSLAKVSLLQRSIPDPETSKKQQEEREREIGEIHFVNRASIGRQRIGRPSNWRGVFTTP